MPYIKVFLVFLILFYAYSGMAAYSVPVTATDGMVVSDHYLASEIGAKVLNQGGNAMDAAVAVGYALAVVYPCCGNIGGGGFMLIHWKEARDIILDFREVAPQKINANLYFDKNKKIKNNEALGYLWVGVPGTVMGLNTALKKYGTWSLKKVMAPAIHLAQKGFILRASDMQNFNHSQKNIFSAPQTPANIKTIFMPGGKPLHLGQRFMQKDLANTLEKISEKGESVFYEGEIAKKVVAASRRDHGVLTLADFKNYQVIWREPFNCHYRDFTIITTPPPGGGASLCEILTILNGFPLRHFGFHSAASIYYNIEAMNQAFYDRNFYLGDPLFVKNPLAWIFAKNRIAEIQQKITQNALIRQNKSISNINTHMNTTHFVVIDKYNNVVNTTYTIDNYYGAMRIAGNTGFLLNNELNDFSLKNSVPNLFHEIQGKTNLLAPGKRPLSSMSPTLVMKNNQVKMALGAAGGPTIITSLVQAIENVIDYGMDIRAAIDSGRFHTQWQPNIIYWEPYAFSPDTLAILEKRNYQFSQNLFGLYPYWGKINAVVIEENGIIKGASDSRSATGKAVGVKTISVLIPKKNNFAMRMKHIFEMLHLT